MEVPLSVRVKDDCTQGMVLIFLTQGAEEDCKEVSEESGNGAAQNW